MAQFGNDNGIFIISIDRKLYEIVEEIESAHGSKHIWQAA